MSAALILILAAAAVVLVLLAWLVRSPHKDFARIPADTLASLEQKGRPHATYFAVIRQAISASELDFFAERGRARLVRRTHKERERIALLYLLELRRDFERLLRLARVIAVLSPEIRARHEFERLSLTVRFYFSYRLALLGLRSGFFLLPPLSNLSLMVSGLAVRMDMLILELGESASAALEIASSLDGRRLDIA